MERVDTFKEGKVYLVYDAEHHRMAVEKHLQGDFRIYEQLQALPHLYLPKLYLSISITELGNDIFSNLIHPEKEDIPIRRKFFPNFI